MYPLIGSLKRLEQLGDSKSVLKNVNEGIKQIIQLLTSISRVKITRYEL